MEKHAAPSTRVWSRWSKEYLQQFQARIKWTRPKGNFKVGDVALLRENQSPRNRWHLGKVVATHPDVQDRVRSVTVLTGNGSKLERPVSKLVLLLEAQCLETEIPRQGA